MFSEVRQYGVLGSVLERRGFFPFPAPASSGLSVLAGFDGMNPNDLWQLWVYDDTPPDAGQIGDGWSITIKARGLR